MYGNTESAAQALSAKLVAQGVKTALYDVSNTHTSYLISEAFRVSHIVFAAVTYNLGIYPVMHNFLMDMKALNVQNRTCAVVENGSWAPKSGDLIEQFLDNQLKLMTTLSPRVSMASSLRPDQESELDTLANAIVKDMAEA